MDDYIVYSVNSSRVSEPETADKLQEPEFLDWKGSVGLFRQVRSSEKEEKKEVERQSRNLLVCAIAVPNNLQNWDSLWEFSRVPEDRNTLESVKCIHRIVNCSTGQVTMILEFKDALHAEIWKSHLHGRRIHNDSEPGFGKAIFAIYVSEVEFIQRNSGNSSNSLWPAYSGGADEMGLFDAVKDMYYQLPTCPMCLERIDSSITGIVLFFCNHTDTRCRCFSEWGEIHCLVCDTARKAMNHANDGSNIACRLCNCKSEIWICMLCGNVGCNRFLNSHAVSHFETTMHRFSLDLHNQYVWDYVGDGYVHRMLLRSSDTQPFVFGEIYEKNNTVSSQHESDDQEQANIILTKLESLRLHYNEMLENQLQRQAEHFESEISKLRICNEDEISKKELMLKQKRIQMNELTERVSSLERKKREMLKKREFLDKKLKQLDEEKAFHENLISSMTKGRNDFDPSFEKEHLEIQEMYLPRIKELDQEIRLYSEILSKKLSEI